MEATSVSPSGPAPRTLIAWLGRYRLVVGAVALGVIAVAMVLRWNWLVAIGLAPILLSLAPCAAMCALGLCMRRASSGACHASSTNAPQELTQAKTSTPQLEIQEGHRT